MLVLGQKLAEVSAILFGVGEKSEPVARGVLVNRARVYRIDMYEKTEGKGREGKWRWMDGAVETLPVQFYPTFPVIAPKYHDATSWSSGQRGEVERAPIGDEHVYTWVSWTVELPPKVYE